MAGPPGVGPRRPRGVAEMLFNPASMLDPSQVVDMRAPAPMDVHFQNGRPTEWFNTANAGGISWNPNVWTIDPGPLNQGHRTPHPDHGVGGGVLSRRDHGVGGGVVSRRPSKK